MTDVSDLITLRGLSAVGQHGVYDFERSGSQVFSADLTLHVDSRKAAQTDDVQYTVDYAKIADAAVEILTGKPVYLLETLAHNLAEMALSTPQVMSVEVTIHKPMAPVRHQFTDVSVTIKRDRQTPATQYEAAAPKSSRVVLSLGSNLGDPEATLIRAVEVLMEVRGLEIDDVSPLVVTAPVLAPGQSPQPNYRNAVVLARTVLPPVELLKALQSVEQQFGRIRDERWGARTLDIDIIDIGGVTEQWPQLELPHPRAQERAFVLYPWSLMAPEASLPDGRKVADLARRAPDWQGILETREDWLREPGQEPVAAPPVLGPPAVLQFPPPPHSPSPQKAPAVTGPVVPPPVAPSATTVAVPRRSRTVTIRGNEVALEEIGGDMAFQKLLRKEWLRDVAYQVAPREPRAAAQPPAAQALVAQSSVVQSPVTQAAPKPAVSSLPKRRTSAAPVPPPPAPIPKVIPEVPDAAGQPELRLPDWRPVREANAVRIVDAVEVTDERDEEQPPEASKKLPRRRVVRPTPTGMMPLYGHREQEGRQ